MKKTLLIACLLALASCGGRTYIDKNEADKVNKRLFELTSLRYQQTMLDRRESLPENTAIESDELAKTASEAYLSSDYETAIIFMDKALVALEGQPEPENK